MRTENVGPVTSKINLAKVKKVMEPSHDKHFGLSIQKYYF